MFIENYSQKIGTTTTHLAFIKSSQVNAYPCGRRRSTNISVNSEGYRIPFDPEARLNTEANNRKHSSLNGFTQTYLKSWDETKTEPHLCLSLAGYFFDITLENGYLSYNDFGNKLVAEAVLADSTASRIYANVVIEDTHLFSGFKEYYTGVLRSQKDMLDTSEDALDIIKSSLEGLIDETENPDNYYFSGLSFSTSPITGGDLSRNEVYYEHRRDETDPNAKVIPQVLASLCILEREMVDEAWGEWKIHQPAYLPKIEHGTTEDSIVVGETHVRHNLRVDKNAGISGNIDIGNTESLPENTTTTGNIRVQNDISAGNNISADKTITANDLSVTNKATIGAELHVENENGDAKAFIDYAGLEYADIEKADIDEVAITILKVQGDESSATIDEALITETLAVHNDERTALIDTDKIQVPYVNNNGEQIAYTDITKTGFYSPFARIAKLEALSGGISSKGSIKAPDLYQTVDSTDMQVPVIELEPATENGETYYQLKISRVGAKPLQN